MALVIRELIRGWHVAFEEMADVRSHDMFLIRSPVPTFATLGLYLFFVLKWGPEFMKNRPAYNLDKIMIVFNAFQIIMNGYLFCCASWILPTLSFICSPVSYTTSAKDLFILRCVWIYYMLKLSDLLDTVFFVLRKKQNQVTFLHVYHHVGMVLLTYGGVKYFAGGHSIFLGLLNSFIHLIMYIYYLLTVVNPEYKKNLWWKKHITQLQIIQFLMLAVIYAIPVVNPYCGYPKFPLILFLIQNSLMLILFSDFYIRTYIKTKKSKNDKQE